MLFFSILLFIVLFALKESDLMLASKNASRLAILAILFAILLTINSDADLGLSTGTFSLYNGSIRLDTVVSYSHLLLYSIALLVILTNTVLKTKAEYPLIQLLSLMGMLLLVSSGDLLVFYLALELQSLGLYVLATIYKNSESATNAGLKYLLLGGLSSGFILLGITLLYVQTGSIDFYDIILLISSNPSTDISFTSQIISIIPTSFIVLGILFKLGSAPFYFWAPDVYNGVPSIVTSWISILPKISLISFLLFIIETYSKVQSTYDSAIRTYAGNQLPSWGPGLEGFAVLQNLNMYNIILWSGILSIIIGSIGAIFQVTIKRLIAFSSISHIGFILTGIAADSSYILGGTSSSELTGSIGAVLSSLRLLSGAQAAELGTSGYTTIGNFEIIWFYLFQYLLTSVVLFYLISIYKINFISEIQNYTKTYTGNQLGSSESGSENWTLKIIIMILFLSLGRIPPFIGFFAKLYILQSILSAKLYFAAIIAVCCSVISAFYYLTMIKLLFTGGSPWFPRGDLAPEASEIGNTSVRSKGADYGVSRTGVSSTNRYDSTEEFNLPLPIAIPISTILFIIVFYMVIPVIMNCILPSFLSL